MRGEVHVFFVVDADEIERLLQDGHHAQAEQIDLDDAHIGAVFLVPLDDDAARHGGRLQRHNAIELTLADHHAAGVLAQMAGQIEDGLDH